MIFYKHEPVISIIMPIYNASRFLAQSLEALMHQTYQNIEILCINDGSTDNSLSILQEFATRDSRIKIFNQKNSGPAKARNTGLDNATGNYLMFCDADDWYEPTMCEEMLQTIIEQNVDLVMCDCNIIETDKNHHRSSGDILYHHLKTIGHTQIDNSNKDSISVLLWNKIFKLDLIRKHQVSFPSGYESDDNAFVYQYLALSSIIYGLNKRLYNYQLLTNSIMGKLYSRESIEKFFHTISIFAFTIKFLQKQHILNQNKWILRSCLSQTNWILDLLPKQEKLIFLKRLNADVLSHFQDNDLAQYPLLDACKQENYKKAIEISHNSKRIKLFGICLFKIKHKGDVIRYYILGFKIFSKKIKGYPIIQTS